MADAAPVRVEQSHTLSSVIASVSATLDSNAAMSSGPASASASAASASASASALADHNGPFKIVGICLAVGSGFFIGASFVVKKKGLLAATKKYGNQAGEGLGYLKNWIWWTGLIMMVIGEILNFVAYAFTEAILVTPMGALSVVICAILSHFFLKESLTFFGWIGCTLCILGATILALNAPEQQSVTTIDGFQHLFLSPGFLVWGSLLIVTSGVLVFFAAPRWGKKNMMTYISICSLIGGISVSCTQGLGASIVTSIQGDSQIKHWFFWFLFVFVVATLLVELQYLNKALELFNTSMVVPVYFCYFSSATLITSFILYQGLKAPVVTIITMVLGFLVICLGITLLQLSKVDPTTFTKMDRRSTMLFQAAKHQSEEAEKGDVMAMEDPGMDALRGGFGAVGSIIRARTVSRRISSAGQFGHYGKPYPYGHASNLSTNGLDGLQRYQLSDTPVRDHGDSVSLHTAKSPIREVPSPSALFPARSKSMLKFEEDDVVHQYGYNRTDEPTHMLRPHAMPHSAPPGGISMSSVPSARQPIYTSRQASANSVYPPVMEEPEDYDGDRDVVSAPMESTGGFRGYPDPYSQSRSPLPHSAGATGASTSKHSLAGMLHLSTSTDPSRKSQSGHSTKSKASRSSRKSRDDVRSGARRGGKDYPHLSKREAGAEKEERRALVRDESDERIASQSDSDASYDTAEAEGYDEPKSAITDESMGHVFWAVRKAAPSPARGNEVEIPPVPRSSGFPEYGAGYDSPRTPRANR